MKPSKKLLSINLEVLKELSGNQQAAVQGGGSIPNGEPPNSGRASGDSTSA